LKLYLTMKFYKESLSKIRLNHTNLGISVLIAAIFAVWPVAADKITTNQQGLAPGLRVSSAAEVNWFEVNQLDKLNLKSRAVILIDSDSGRIIGAKQPRLVLPLASLSKLMAVKLVLDYGLRPEQVVLVSPTQIAQQTSVYVDEDSAISQIGLRQAESFRVADLLIAAVVASANDAVIALVNGAQLPGSYGAAAQKQINILNLNETRLFEPTGLDPANVSTAFDVARLADAVWRDNYIREFSHQSAVNIKSSSGSVYKLTNTNVLAGAAGNYRVLASKTGHLNEVGYNLAQIIRLNNGQRYLMVLLGAPTATARIEDANLLANWISS